MFYWKKLGRIFNPLEVVGVEWLSEFAQAPSTLVFDNFVRVFFSGRPKPDLNGQYVSYTGYVDLNRKNLFEIQGFSAKPILNLGELGTFDEFGIYPTSVIRDRDKVRAYYAGWTRCESVPYNVAIGMAESVDGGTTFTKTGKGGPILSYDVNEPMTVSGPKIRKFNNQWVLWYVAGNKWVPGLTKPESVFKIRMAQSEDGVTWKKFNRDVLESRLEENECQASPDVFFHGGKYHMFFCYKYSFDFRNRERGYRIGYAQSTDMVNWERDDAKSGIKVSEEGWDSEMISYPHVFELDGKIYMFYLGNQVGKSGFGLAELQGTLE